jgi:hypothetical protein
LAKFHRVAWYPAEISYPCRLKTVGSFGPGCFERRTAVSKTKRRKEGCSAQTFFLY